MHRFWVLVVMVACGDDGGGGGGGGGGPLTQEQVDNACIAYTACFGGGEGVNDCLTDTVSTLAFSTVNCLAAAGTDCTALKVCLSSELVADPSCTGTSMCSGDDAVQCSDGVRATTHCGAADTLGPTCVIDTNGRAQCAVSTCTADSATCSGDLLQVCDADRGLLRERDCSARGMSCVAGRCSDASGGATCATTGPGVCDGPVISQCVDGIEVRTDCASQIVGSTCIAVTTPFPDVFCGFGTACYPDKGGETCSGSMLTYCSNGMITTVDCVALGYSSCRVSTIGGGYCVP